MVVFLAWYSAVQKPGVERAGLFNGVIPVAALAAVSAVGTGTVSGLHAAGAAAVAAGILAGLTGPAADPQKPGRHRRQQIPRPQRVRRRQDLHEPNPSELPSIDQAQTQQARASDRNVRPQQPRETPEYRAR